MADMTREDVIAELELAKQQEKTAFFYEKDLSCLDLSGLHIENADFQRANLQHVFFSDSKFTNVSFSHANCSHAFFIRTVLHNCRLNNANFESVNFADATLVNTSCVNTNFFNATFKTATLNNVNLDYSSGIPMWCGGTYINVDKPIFYQLIAHLCSLNIDDEKCKKVQKYLMRYAKLSHRYNSIFGYGAANDE